jgi:hypothetical protein
MNNLPEQQPDNNDGDPLQNQQPNDGGQNDPDQQQGANHPSAGANPGQPQDADPNVAPNVNPDPTNHPMNQPPAPANPVPGPNFGNQQPAPAPANNQGAGPIPVPLQNQPGANNPVQQGNNPFVQPGVPQAQPPMAANPQAAAQAFQQAASNFAAAQAAAAAAGIQLPPVAPFHPPAPFQPVPQAFAQLPPLPLGIPPPFSLFPGRASNAPLNLRTSSSDIKLYNKGIEGLVNKYDLAPIGLQQFLSSVLARVIAFGWDRTINIPDSLGISRNLINEYGLLSMEDIMRYILTYFNLATKEAQDSVMLYQFLSNSLTIETRTEMCVYEDQYLVDYIPMPGAPAIKIGSGACFLKAIIGKAVLDAMASVNTLRAAIRNLDKKLIELQSNIK